jgi:hypothetical protein
MLFRRLLRLAVLAAVATAVSTAVQMLRDRATSKTSGAAATPEGVDTWPEVPRNPEG